MKLDYLCLGLVAALLGFSVAAESGLVASKLRYAGKAPIVSLRKALPSELPGWQVEHLRIGPTETDSSEIARTLNFDQLIFRRYHSAMGSFSLYVAYWPPQKMSPVLVGGHTPDRCWVSSGWTCDAESLSWTCDVDHKPLFPAQYRVFHDAAGEVQQVIYWHLSGGKPFGGDYHINSSRSIFAYWKSVFLYHTGGNDEQYFIRINSQQSFESLWNDPGFRKLMEALAKLCLADPVATHSKAAGDARGSPPRAGVTGG
ncbi:hypothetical protein GALL_199330 [mine drainage metagenome]|uniref:Methanolan biosynthesis EpsI domain-containing protein n=1 Tax=mine drainage metagenome TaxID=410659 RepID=A0A1J5S148_9ZZZZ